MRDKQSKYDYLAPILRERAKTMGLVTIAAMPDIPCGVSTLQRMAKSHGINLKSKEKTTKAARAGAKARKAKYDKERIRDYTVSDLSMSLLTSIWNNQLNLRG